MANANKTITIANAKKIVKDVAHLAALNFTENIDKDKRVFEKLTQYSNVFQLDNELMVVGQKGQEFFVSNKYAVSQD